MSRLPGIAEAVHQIQAGERSAVELTESVLARIEERNSELGAYLHVDADGALAQARAADAERRPLPLRGIPLCVKDNIDVAGMPTTAGASRWRRLPERDATVVARLRKAGAVIVGKGHTNEFAYGIDGANEHWGDCRNPDDPARICGGSSSGPAVATAAGMALAGLGTDTAGSLRVPASFCGVVGVRTTLGRLPSEGVVPLADSFDTVGPLARTAEDAAILLDVMTGDGDGHRDRIEAPLRGLRLGLLEQLLESAEDYVARGVLDTARRLENLGAKVVPVRLKLLRHAAAIQPLIQQAEAARSHGPWFEVQQEHYSQPVRTRLEVGRLLPASAYLTAQQARQLLIGETAERMRGLDALLAPSTPVVAPIAGSTEIEVRGQRRPLRSALLAFVVLASQLGAPAVSAPIGRHEGLAYGLQLIGRPRSEPLLLRLAAACQDVVD
jgi:Asp-tRNA(Asn)/Glu-tRNA(Gln) amidotransferase A subunit family amidase